MDLTEKGAHAAQLGGPEAAELLGRLMSGESITDYTTSVCYDTVAFCSYLGQRFGIQPGDLLAKSGQDWLPIFDFDSGTKWVGQDIPAGSAVGFRRPDKYFHAAVGIGGTQVRGVNGFLLSPGWSEVVDLTTVIKDPDEDGAFEYDGTKIQVFFT